MEPVYILGAVVALVVAYFLFFRKPSDEGAPRELEQHRERRLEVPEHEPAPEQLERAPEVEHEAPAEAPAPQEAEPAHAPPPAEDTAELESLRQGLSKSRESQGFFGRLKALLAGKREIDASVTEQIEEVLLTSDVGVSTTQAILKRLNEGLERGELGNVERVWEALRDEAVRILEVEGRHGKIRLASKPTVVLLVGVNGAGKTTTIGKLATQLKAEGKSCVLAAGDTFRAAAVQQLLVWGERVGCEVVRGKDGADPGSVVFDAIKRAQQSGADVVLADTAGRLHTKTNLMAQLTKVAKTAGKALDGAPHEILLVLDATNGQNALAQAKEFKETLEVSGIVLTKLDGTAKGGVVIGVCDALEIPVRFIGLGERPDDLHEFSPKAFVKALLGREI